jgi:hypothetical protein
LTGSDQRQIDARLWVPTVLAVALLVSCTGSETQPESTTTAVQPGTTATTTTTTVATTTTTTTLPAEEESTSLGSATFRVPFTMEPPPGSTVSASFRFMDRSVEFRKGRDEWLLFTVGGDFESWVRRLSEGAGVTLSEPFETTLGGVPGEGVDVTTTDQQQTIFSHTVEGNIYGAGASPGDLYRLYVHQVEGEWIAVIVLSNPEQYEAWLAEAEALLATLQWGAAP